MSTSDNIKEIWVKEGCCLQRELVSGNYAIEIPKNWTEEQKKSYEKRLQASLNRSNVSPISWPRKFF